MGRAVGPGARRLLERGAGRLLPPVRRAGRLAQSAERVASEPEAFCATRHALCDHFAWSSARSHTSTTPRPPTASVFPSGEKARQVPCDGRAAASSPFATRHTRTPESYANAATDPLLVSLVRPGSCSA